MSEDYTPHGKTRSILDRAYELVQSVPYAVSARWLFYRLLQEGCYSGKQDYKNKFLPTISAARHAFYKGWRPDTLADDTREAVERGTGSQDVTAWLESVASYATCRLDKWIGQKYYVELWYEARAMTQQFRHYTEYITLRPMGGQPSIDYKWKTAKALEDAYALYDRPVVVLYFGDLDEAGETISEVVERDVRKWCDVDFDFIRCGLTPGQVVRYDVPENFEHPGAYQWEALSDEGAREIITNGTAPFLSHDVFSQRSREEHAATVWVREQLAELVGRWPGHDYA